MKIRKNAADLSGGEWKRYCKAIVALKHTITAGSSISIYDQFVAIHLGVWGLKFDTREDVYGRDGGHRGPAFLPWHREYLRRYEEALAAIDPTVTLPYWNWGLGGDAETNILFQVDHMGPRGGTVTRGYFAGVATAQNDGLPWIIHKDLRPQHSLRPTGSAASRLWRSGTDGAGALPPAAAVFEVLGKPLFSQFRPALEGGDGLGAGHAGMHNGVHGWMGGDMAFMSSPNDPIFFMHHAQIDRLWASWQRKHPGVKNYNKDELYVGEGHGRYDGMWPWHQGKSAPRPYPSGWSQSPNPAVAVALLPTETYNSFVTPARVMDIEALGYLYQPKKKETSDELSTLAGKILSGAKAPTPAEVKSLAASVLSQDVTRGKRAADMEAEILEYINPPLEQEIAKKETSDALSSLAAKILSGKKKATLADAKKLAGSVLSQDVTKGKRK